MSVGKLIAFEGIHGCGKSTQIELLRTRLEDMGVPIIVTKEVAGTSVADNIKNIIFEISDDDPLTTMLLIAASRANRMKHIIFPALQEGITVITDRYKHSMIIEQHYGHGVNRALVEDINRAATRDKEADLTILIDTDVQTTNRRLRMRAEISYWDSQPNEYHEVSRKNYLDLAESEPKWVKINGSQSIDQIADEIFKHVSTLLKLKV
jgi:dTMP kinase